MLVSVVQQSELAMGILTSPLFWISFPFRSPQSTESSSLYYIVSSYYLSVLYTAVYVCKSQSIPPPPPHSPLVSVCVLCVCVSYFYFAGKFTYTVFLFLTPFTLRQSLGPFTSLQMAQFRSFLRWLIFHCMYVPHLYSFL